MHHWASRKKESWGFVLPSIVRMKRRGHSAIFSSAVRPVVGGSSLGSRYSFLSNSSSLQGKLQTKMTTPESVLLYYATLSGIATQGGHAQAKPQQKGNNPLQKSGDRSFSVPKEIPQLDLQGEEYWDTHTHIDQILKQHNMPLEAFEEFKASHFKNGFGGCVTVCCEKKSFKPTRLLMQYDSVYAAFGIHPHNAKAYSDEIENQIIEMMSHPKTVAWGEMGLDYHYNFSEPGEQRDVFARQLQKAVQLNKPMVIHSREAEEDTLMLMKQHVPKDWRVHVHCFTDSVRMAKALLNEWPNCFIGITGAVTFGTSDRVRDVVKVVPIDRLLLETDGPYMAPMPYRGQICHSGHIPFTALKISEIKGVAIGELLKATTANAKKMYGIP